MMISRAAAIVILCALGCLGCAQLGRRPAPFSTPTCPPVTGPQLPVELLQVPPELDPIPIDIGPPNRSTNR